MIAALSVTLRARWQALGESRRDLVLVVVLAALAFLPALGNRDLWNPDEARYAEVAREMVESGDLAHFFVPHLNGEVYTQKPPLLFWSMAAFGALVGGVGETTARLPLALSAIAATALTFAIGRRLFGRRAAWIAALAFATAGQILWQGRFGQIDMLLIALVTLAMAFFVRGWTEARPLFYLAFFAATGLATLAKGPVGLLPPLLAILVFLFWSRQREEIPRLGIGRGLLLWLAVVLLWLGPAAWFGGWSYFEQLAFRQTVTRYADPWHHFQPWYYYLTTIPANFFPWTLFLPAAIVGLRGSWGRPPVAPTVATADDRSDFGRRGRHSVAPTVDDDRFRRFQAGVRFALSWILVTIVFFSVSPAKRSVYVLTMFPALALFLGAGLDALALRLADESRKQRPKSGWMSYPAFALTVLASLLAAALAVVGGSRPEAAALGGAPFARLAAACFLPISLGAAWAFFASRRGQFLRASAGIAAGMALFSLAANFWLLPKLDAVKSARGLSRELLARSAPNEPYAIYPRIDSTFLFYTRRFAELPTNEAELQTFASRPGRVWLLIQRDDLAKLTRPLPLIEYARDADPREGYVLLGKP